MSSSTEPIRLEVPAEARFARLVRMTAANVAALSSMSVDRVEDVRMAAEEAFIYACSAAPSLPLGISFDVDDERVVMTFELGDAPAPDEIVEGPAAYVDLILTAVSDSYEKTSEPERLVLELRADVRDAS